MPSRIAQTPRRTTLSDIARQAGVSISTASAVLTNKETERRISASVALRVRQAAMQMDYSPNLLVQSLQQGRTYAFSFFNGYRDLRRDDLYLNRLVNVIQRASGLLGYDILTYCDFRRSVEETYRYLNSGRSDGLLFFAPQIEDPLLTHLHTSRMPVVLINNRDEQDTAQTLSSIQDDQMYGMQMVAEALTARGHRRIAAFMTQSDKADSQKRIAFLQGYLTALDLPIPQRWIIALDDQVEEIGPALSFLLGEDDPPTALFCWHDFLGYQVLEHCERLGITVPEQLSVIGYDGLHWPAKTSHLLASVSVDLEILGEQAVKMLHSMVSDQALPISQVIPVTLDVGTTLSVS